MIETYRNAAGIAVVVGADDLDLAAQLGQGSRLLVQVLDADESKVARARPALHARGLSGQVSAEHLTGAGLPYPDNLVNLLVVVNQAAVSEEELRRVLAPHGTAWLRAGKSWRPLPKPWPKEFDEWTHWRHGADGNMVSQDSAVGLPGHLRWVGGPPQDAGGKRWYNDNILVSAQGRNFYVHDESVIARDAFNGALLWQRAFKPYVFKETGTDLPTFLLTKAKLGVRTSKVRPVAMGDRLYIAAEGNVLALDAATGRTVLNYGRVSSPRELLVEGNLLVVSDTNVIRAFRIAPARLAWQIPFDAERMVAGDGRLLCFGGSQIAGFELATGRERWRTTNTNAIPVTTCTYHEGFFILEKSSWRDDTGGCGLIVYAGADGRLLWQKDYKPDMTHQQESRAFFAQGLVWVQTQGDKVVGLDPVTGKQKQSWSSRGKHCATPVATERYFIAPECDFTDFATGSRSATRMFKNACRLPFVPGNGLLYSFPVQCECYPMLRGYMGLAAGGLPAQKSSPGFIVGPALGAVAATEGTGDADQDWPIYRHDAFRSGATRLKLRDGAMRSVWSAKVAEAAVSPLAEEWKNDPFAKATITPPVVAGGMVFVAVPQEHRVTALDADTGQVRWSFLAGGRIDTPPTVAEGHCLFGSHDGWVYCVRAVDGALAWQRRVAPQEAWIPAYGQMESVWPVAGSVLVDSGVAYCVAGRHPHADGGVRMAAVNVRTGQVVWEKTINDLALKHWYGWEVLPNRKVGLDFEPVDLVVRDGDQIAMSRWRINPRDGAYKLVVNSVAYQGPGLTVPRGVWGYGVRQKKILEDKAPAVFGAATIFSGEKGDVALLRADTTLVRATAAGELMAGGQTIALAAPAVHDGLAAARGRLYVSMRDGAVGCFE